MFYRHSNRPIGTPHLILIGLTTSIVVMDHFANQSATPTNVGIEARPRQ